MSTLDRLSLNQATVKYAPFAEVLDLCRDSGIRHVGVWRDTVASLGAPAVAHLLAEAGVTASSLCRGGFLTSADPQARSGALADNRAAIREAYDIGSHTLVLVSGGLPEGRRDLPAVREQVVEAIGELVPLALELGVRLAIEPLHPMFCADRCVVSTLGQALDMARRFPAAAVGVVVDTYHVWWDPELASQVARAGDRIASFQVCDWVVPLPQDMLLGRGHLGDGFIDFKTIAHLVEQAGYTGPVEVEIFNEAVWSTPPAETVRTVVERFRRHLG